MAIPAPIVQAICKVMTSVEAVKKSQRNAHGGYQFASTDDIYAALTRKMGEVGLVLITLEETAEIKRVEKDGKSVQWLNCVFSFILATAEATWSDPRARRTLMIQVTGPQTFQAAQSYAEKAYLRSLFKLPTGDMDLDGLPQAETEEDQVSLVQPVKRKSSYAAKKDGKSPAMFDEINRHIAGSHDAPSLRFVRETYAREWAELPLKWADLLDGEYETRMLSFGEVQAAE
jgi:hypothetical protein